MYWSHLTCIIFCISLHYLLYTLLVTFKSKADALSMHYTIRGILKKISKKRMHEYSHLTQVFLSTLILHNKHYLLNYSIRARISSCIKEQYSHFDINKELSITKLLFIILSCLGRKQSTCNSLVYNYRLYLSLV